jgi:hypothetical protein
VVGRGWLLVKVKVVATVNPAHAMEVYRGIWNAAPRFLNIGTIGGQIHAAAALPQEKERLMTLNRGQGKPQGRTGRFGEKFLSQAENELPPGCRGGSSWMQCW